MGPEPRLSAGGDLEGGLLHSAVVFGAILVFGLLFSAAIGDPLQSQGKMLVHLAGQQLLVVGVGAFLCARAAGMVPANLLGRAGAFPWLWVTLCLAPGTILWQAPAIEAWAATFGLSEPEWYAQGLRLETPLGTAMVFLVVAGIAPICEELFFRGYLFGRLRSVGVWAAVLLQAVVFALYHLDLYGLPVYLGTGALLGLVRVVSGSLWPCIVLHAINNAVGILDIERGETLFALMGGWAWLAAAASLLCGGLWLVRAGSLSTTAHDGSVGEGAAREEAAGTCRGESPDR